MDGLSIIGLLLAVGAILFGAWLEGGQLAFLLNAPALIIVLGGTLGATMLESPRATFLRSLKMLPWLFLPPKFANQEAIERILELSRLARKDGLLGLEKALKQGQPAFLQKGLALVVDGHEPDAIRETLEIELHTREVNDLQAARVFDAMGGYSPTIGIIGAVLGLIHVMNNLSDPEQLGPGIAVAFVATIYGVGLANVIFLPVANKLKAVVMRESQYEMLVAAGMVGIAQGANPRVIESRLKGLLRT